MENPGFSRHIFWETDYDKIDWEGKWRYVIERVVDYGSWDDLMLLKSRYSDVQIRQAVMESRNIREKTLHFFSVIWNEPLENFRCFTWRQSTPIHFPF